ncbi:hypothetical protein THERMOS_860 [Bathymodiolus thermophilus thioautotrophic gill symbiont]|uniref:Uncharacterized protein n=1 Tax=Bathymodiolus thermophilus thioautotrophic gill symbiont TaxID=2360 RepID=A0A8H8XBD0_9GAMM|nr:hypothetical protein THERMOS_860 [Bathymodiolus thermophilus thioautotrophic gill symbiont]
MVLGCYAGVFICKYKPSNLATILIKHYIIYIYTQALLFIFELY